jgi:hypothetical protein
MTLKNSCLNSLGPTKAAAESNERNNNLKSKEALVKMVSELSVFLLENKELEEGKIKTFFIPVLIKYTGNSVQ